MTMLTSVSILANAESIQMLTQCETFCRRPVQGCGQILDAEGAS